MEQLNNLIINFIDLSAEASPWLLLGLLIAGLMKAWVPSQLLSKHLGQGKSAVIKAALIGAPLPLCSCGVIPVAAELRRSGASAPATSSFLVATPETGVDSVSVSYALLGPVVAIYRPIVSILSAILTGFLVATAPKINTQKSKQETKQNTSTCCGSKKQVASNQVNDSKGCCNTKEKKQITSTVTKESCCSSTKTCGATNDTNANKHSNSVSKIISKTKQGVYYASTQLIDDIIIWLLVGLIFASLISTFLPSEFLLSYGSGLPAMLLMIIISIPMYICATASTPIAAGFIMAGLSPGTALVFMMAGPATNISTLGVIRNEMGTPVLIRYLLGVALSAILFGLMLDIGLSAFEINISDQMSHSHELLPHWFGLSCAIIITLLACKPLRKKLLK